ncbi:MAG: hypothetical protein R6W92_03055 [Desulfocurvibacter africanus]
MGQNAELPVACAGCGMESGARPVIARQYAAAGVAGESGAA